LFSSQTTTTTTVSSSLQHLFLSSISVVLKKKKKTPIKQINKVYFIYVHQIHYQFIKLMQLID
jgi:hypothetical protein